MKDLRKSTGKDTRLSKMGHRVVPEKEWHPRGVERYAGPVHSTRGPRRDRPVAVVGASADRGKFGNKAVRAYSGDGYTVWPVNPKGDDVEGLHAYRSLGELPGMPFVVSIYLHEGQALGTLESLADIEAEKHDSPAVIYLNPGTDTGPVVDRARELGLYAVPACSIRAIGHDPAEYPDG